MVSYSVKCDYLLSSSPIEEFMCPLAQKGKLILVHWVYYPDSYDCWVPASEVGVAPEPPSEAPKQWLVSILINASLV